MRLMGLWNREGSFHEWLNGVMFSEKEVKTYQAFPVKVAPVIEDDIKLKIEGPAPVQARPTFLRRVYYHLPSGIQDRVKPIVKNYIKREHSNFCDVVLY